MRFRLNHLFSQSLASTFTTQRMLKTRQDWISVYEDSGNVGSEDSSNMVPLLHWYSRHIEDVAVKRKGFCQWYHRWFLRNEVSLTVWWRTGFVPNCLLFDYAVQSCMYFRWSRSLRRDICVDVRSSEIHAPPTITHQFCNAKFGTYTLWYTVHYLWYYVNLIKKSK